MWLGVAGRASRWRGRERQGGRSLCWGLLGLREEGNPGGSRSCSGRMSWSCCCCSSSSSERTAGHDVARPAGWENTPGLLRCYSGKNWSCCCWSYRELLLTEQTAADSSGTDVGRLRGCCGRSWRCSFRNCCSTLRTERIAERTAGAAGIAPGLGVGWLEVSIPGWRRGCSGKS